MGHVIAVHAAVGAISKPLKVLFLDGSPTPNAASQLSMRCGVERYDVPGDDVNVPLEGQHEDCDLFLLVSFFFVCVCS